MGRQGTRLIFARHAFNQVLLAVWGLAAALFALLGALRLLYLYPRLSRLAGWLVECTALDDLWRTNAFVAV